MADAIRASGSIRFISEMLLIKFVIGYVGVSLLINSPYRWIYGQKTASLRLKFKFRQVYMMELNGKQVIELKEKACFCRQFCDLQFNSSNMRKLS